MTAPSSNASTTRTPLSDQWPPPRRLGRGLDWPFAAIAVFHRQPHRALAERR